ncbi:MAG: aminodeoxychorismate synthase component I [Bacteroidetes bacterium]|nr:MAG: aminodeoxychorismate synthase component I [Bacteroidota bacterium]
MQYKKTKLKHHSEYLLNHLLNISNEFNTCCLLNSNDFTHNKYSNYSWIFALGNIDYISYNVKDSYNSIDNFLNRNLNEWKFAYMSYDLKNEFENLSSNNADSLGFNDIYIFVPKFIIKAGINEIELEINSKVSSKEVANFKNKLANISKLDNKEGNISLSFKHRITKEQYIESISKIRSDIKYGDIYEMNFCQEFYVENAAVKPIEIYKKLNEHSPAPFSSYFKENEHFIMSASPERYIQKTGDKLISQPIKGTAKRSHNNNDVRIKNKLQNSTKERAENIMIVDLVRNDLSRIKSSENVQVEELCEIYSFPHVHQMISTISAKVDNKLSISNILKNTFPMGSMTGAPKIKAMELIEKYETTKRGVFSGSVGYIDNKGDFDFNVIIRTLLYNSKTKFLSLTTGGAITYLSDAEQEYEESLLKAKAIFDAFGRK